MNAFLIGITSSIFLNPRTFNGKNLTTAASIVSCPSISFIGNHFVGNLLVQGARNIACSHADSAPTGSQKRTDCTSRLAKILNRRHKS